jgi:hypothetical protein
MDDSFAQLRHDLEHSVACRAGESKLERNARHIDELQQIVLRLLELLHDQQPTT